MHFQSVDRIVHWEFGYLGIERWHREGLPLEITAGEGPGSVEAYFGVDPCVWVPLNCNLIPPFPSEVKVLEDHGHLQVFQRSDGMIFESPPTGSETIPRFIKFPITNRDDWKKFKERLDPSSPERFLTDWKAIGEELRFSDLPVGIWFGSFLGVPRNWIGFENIALMFYDDRPLIEEIIATLTTLYYSQIECAIKEIDVDFAGGWEDICFRSGPIISPSMFAEIVVPHMKKVTGLLRAHGCDVIWTDCDGDIRKLVPLFLEAGVNCMFPLEVFPGSDPVELRKEYGKAILLRGGLDKHKMSGDKKDILGELKRVEKVVEEGGYIPHIDHRVPADMSYENYRYYIREKLALLGWSNEEVSYVWPVKDMVPDYCRKGSKKETGIWQKLLRTTQYHLI
ncbi:MAG TPA: uroporphyrinogen decarboxylase family protein [bacterium]|nr:uroporphyrinogen decarboxylase family protein [bacterium]